MSVTEMKTLRNEVVWLARGHSAAKVEFSATDTSNFIRGQVIRVDGDCQSWPS